MTILIINRNFWGGNSTNDKMETLFNENIIFVFFFAMIAIYNYSDLKEYQRMAIIYISVYALTVLDIIGVKLAIALLVYLYFALSKFLHRMKQNLKF